MATLALMAVGNAIWPAAAGQIAVGATIGAMAGSYIDQAYIMPALFPSDNQRTSVGKLDELQIQSASEGSPINRCLGEAVRCTGTVIWLPELIEVQSTEEVGGKGGGGGGSEITTYSYYMDIAIGVCKGPRYVARIWANGTLIYSIWQDYNQIINPTGNIFAIGLDAYGGTQCMDVVYDNDGVLPNFTVGLSVECSGAGLNEANQGNYFTLVNMYVDDYDLTHLQLRNRHAVTQVMGGSNILFSQAASNLARYQYDSLAIYNGDDDNLPDPTIESYMGAGKVPNFNGLCYVVFHRFKLSDYGNTKPNFSFLTIDHIDLPA